MANLSKATFFDAGKNKPRTRAIVVDGERRMEHIPNGAVERWVNSAGNVCFQQLLQPGAIPSVETIDARRGSIRRRKPVGAELMESENEWRWIEWHKCPLRTGVLTSSYFPEGMREACPDGVKITTALKACPHVEHTIAKRQEANRVAQGKLHEAATLKRLAEEAEKAAANERAERALAQQAEANAAMIAIAKSLGQAAAAPPPADPAPAGEKPKK